MKKKRYRRKITFEKKQKRISPEFDRVVASAGLLAKLDWSSHWSTGSIVNLPGWSGFNNYEHKDTNCYYYNFKIQLVG